MPRFAWTVVSLVILSGAYLGWEAAANRNSRVYAASVGTRIISSPQNSTVAIVRIPVASSTQRELALEVVRLKTRNRRLEALNKILRERGLENTRRVTR